MAVAELFVILCVTVLTTFAILISITRSIYTWRLLSILVPLFILGAVVLSLTYFMTTVARSARVGLVLSLGLVLLGLLVPAGFRAWSKTDIPSPMDLMSATKWIMNSAGSFHFRLMAAWSLVALAFPWPRSGSLNARRYEAAVNQRITAGWVYFPVDFFSLPW